MENKQFKRKEHNFPSLKILVLGEFIHKNILPGIVHFTEFGNQIY